MPPRAAAGRSCPWTFSFAWPSTARTSSLRGGRRRPIRSGRRERLTGPLAFSSILGPAEPRGVCTGLAGLADAAWPYAAHLYPDDAFDWPDFDPGLLAKVRPAFPGLPPAGVALALRIWGHVHGLVSLEVYGHLRSQTVSPDKLFRAELTALVRSLGMPVLPREDGAQQS
ncbi:TetR-like C-terminal domain-containing protein [Streptomyces sp. NPDC003035]|uniref:TetR-like C-terminal domain-containing protein n=1 Tax=Streptomyces sp. NPDC003035 TaxID=3364676 RepID=UPI0036BA1D2A